MITRRPIFTALGGLCAAPALAASAFAAPAAIPVVTVLGDSITAGLGLDARDALPQRLQEALGAHGIRAMVRAAGVSGDTTAGGLARLDFSVQKDTTVCVVELGGNDYLQSVDPEDTRANLTQIARRLKARGIKVILAGTGAPLHGAGTYGRDFDAAFVAAARDGGAILVPDVLKGIVGTPALIQADGLHPNAAGVKLLAGRLEPAVARALHGR